MVSPTSCVKATPSMKSKHNTQEVFLLTRQSMSLSKTEDQQPTEETCSTSTWGESVGRALGRRDCEGKRASSVEEESERGSGGGSA